MILCLNVKSMLSVQAHNSKGSITIYSIFWKPDNGMNAVSTGMCQQTHIAQPHKNGRYTESDKNCLQLNSHLKSG